jgi:hypothetical protein
VHHEQVVLAGELHDPLEERPVHAHRGGVVRERQDEQLGLRPRELRRFLKPREEIVGAAAERHRDQIPVGDDDRVGVDRVGRVRHQGAVAGLQHGQRQVGQAFLGPDGGDGLAVRIERHAVAVAVPLGDRDAESGDAARGRVAVVFRVLGGLDQLGHDVLRRAQIRIAHAEVDDVLTPRAGLGLEIVDDRKDVGGQALDSIELIHAASPVAAMILRPLPGCQQTTFPRGVTARCDGRIREGVWPSRHPSDARRQGR